MLDLSKTKVETIEKSAFSGCTGLTGVILPDTLEVLGTSDGGSGSVFNGCSSLQFVRTSSSEEDTIFELPANLKVIGKQTFKNTFPKGSDLKITIPSSVEIIGSEAFYSNSCFSQIYIERTSGYDGYDSRAFKASSTTDSLLIFPSSDAYNATGSFTRITKTCPVTLDFMNSTGSVATQTKLYGQSIQYTQDSEGIWYVNEAYTLPETGTVSTVPGYDAGWKIDGSKSTLTNTSKVSGTVSVDENGQGIMAVTVENSAVVSKPTVEYTVNGEIVQTDTGVAELSVTIDDKNPGSVGVQVTHPLATEEAKESGTYVYFKYCWWDEVDNGVNGPRSESEPDLFSSSTSNRVYTDQASIPIRSISDARTDGDYYLVEIYGYYVENNGSPKQFYKSNHNFIGVAQDGTHGEGFIMEVDVADTTPITITPADITVYTGGEGYTGVVDNAGHETAASNGLPEPGFYITLPNWLNEQLGGNANAEDLSQILTISYNDDNGTTRKWNLELYGTKEHSTTVAGSERTRYIYRILPGVDENNEEIPIRLKLTDPNDPSKEITSDEFTPSLTELYKEFDMSIFSGGLNTSKITAQLNVNGQTVTCGVESDTGKLVVRGLTGEDTTTDIVNSESQLSSSNISAVAPNDATYYINGSNVELSDPSGVKLLIDDVVDDGVLAKYIQESLTDYIPAGNYAYAQQYLDLVDTKNGNAYLTMGDGQKLTVYWPVPDDFDSSKNFYLVHFDGLDRNYKDIADELKDNPPDLHNTKLVTVNGTQYIQFETGAFSPFVLVYEQKAGGGTGTRDDYTLHYVTNGGNHLSSETKSSAWTKDYEDLPTPVRDGYTFEGWYWDLRLTEPVTGDVKVDKTTVTLYAKWSEKLGPDDTGVSGWLETDEHNAFLSGYPDGSFQADKNMTRAEVAQMFYALLLDKNVTITKTFSDVEDDAWYATAVNTMASLGMLGGYPDGTFRPDAPITRAEFAAIALAFAYDPASASCSYTDVSANAWYYTYVAQATTYGWIGGYPDGSFRPNNSITRAEVAVIVNNMLGRSADKSYIDRNADELVSFVDLSKTHWAYYTIMEATNTHDYTTSSNGESWKA